MLRYGGMGHTMSIHATDDDVILEFGLHKPAFRIVVNTPTTHGSVGLTTGLDPAMTLGCGGHGGNITSDNISPHPPAQHQAGGLRTPAGGRASAAPRRPAGTMPDSGSSLRPVVPERVRTLDAPTLSARIDAFLASRGIAKDATLVVGGTARPGRPRAGLSSP